MIAKMTRSSLLGFAVNTSPIQKDGGYYFEKPTSPQWVGTVKTLYEKMGEDAYLKSLTNTYHSSCYFLKVKGVWMRLIDFDEYPLTRKYEGSYISDQIDVEVEPLEL